MIVMPGIMRGRLTSHDGALADFVNGTFYAKPGSNFANAQSMFTWSSSTKWTRNASGVLVASGANTPAYEWTSAGVALGIRAEGARTNQCLHSDDLSNAAWSPVNTSVTTNQANGPTGSATLDLLKENTATAGHSIQLPSSTTIVQPYTLSCFARLGPGSRGIMLYGLNMDGRGVGFNLTNGTTFTVSGISLPTLSYGVEDWGGGLYRCFAAFTSAATTGAAGGIYLTSGTAFSYTGDNTSGAYIGSVQLEAGAFPSSYIPTTTTSVTRNADSILRTLASEFSATAGTLIATFSVPSIASSSSDRVIVSIDDGTANERFRYRIQSTQADADFLVTDGGVAQADIDGPAISANTTVKAALAWAANDFELVVNGTSAGTDVSGTLPTVTTINLGSGPSGADGLFGHIQRIEYWPSRLTQGQLVGLTS